MIDFITQINISTQKLQSYEARLAELVSYFDPQQALEN